MNTRVQINFVSVCLVNTPKVPVCRVQGKISRHTSQMGVFLCTGQTVENKIIRQKALKPRPFDGYRVQNKSANIDTFRINISVLIWRRGRDLNPRKAKTFNGFQDRRIQPDSATSPGKDKL